jgi:TonB-dependent receptor
LNFNLDTSENTKIRFSAAKVISRPNLQDLGKGFSKGYTRVNDDPNYDGTYFQFTGGSKGNPQLDPYRATQADVVFEYYFDDLGYASVGAFTKSVESFIANETRAEFGSDEAGGRFQGVSKPFNGSGGSVTGFELAFQQSWENDLGFSTNYTYSDNSADVNTTLNADVGLPGVSKHSFNMTGFYENDIISARISYTWRDDYLSPYRSAFDVDGTEEGGSEFYNSYGQVDASISWNATDFMSVDAAVLNLTGESQSSYFAFEDNPMSYQSQEPRIVVGVTARF